MNWADLLPPQVAVSQAAYERAGRVLNARRAGATLTQIAERMGRSVERVRQLENKATKQTGKLSPIEKYYWERGEVYALHDILRRR
jgi:hypothetical protein